MFLEEDRGIELPKFSKWLRFPCIMGWVLRFQGSCRILKVDWVIGTLPVNGLDVAELRIVKEVQKCEFKDEFRAVAIEKKLSSTNKLSLLWPNIDDLGTLCVGDT